MTPTKTYAKELQTQTGNYDYGFRQLDPALGRWFVGDALAESFYDETPYGYASNNPVNNIDVDGLFTQPRVWGEGIKYGGGNNINGGLNFYRYNFEMSDLERVGTALSSLMHSFRHSDGGTWSNDNGLTFFNSTGEAQSFLHSLKGNTVLQKTPIRNLLKKIFNFIPQLTSYIYLKTAALYRYFFTDANSVFMLVPHGEMREFTNISNFTYSDDNQKIVELTLDIAQSFLARNNINGKTKYLSVIVNYNTSGSSGNNTYLFTVNNKTQDPITTSLQDVFQDDHFSSFSLFVTTNSTANWTITTNIHYMYSYWADYSQRTWKHRWLWHPPSRWIRPL